MVIPNKKLESEAKNYGGHIGPLNRNIWYQEREDLSSLAFTLKTNMTDLLK